MFNKYSQTNTYHDSLQRGVIIFLIILSIYYSFSLFHAISESICIVIGFSAYIVTWNSRRLIANKYFVFFGIAIFYVAIFNLLHLFSDSSSGVLINQSGYSLSDYFDLASRYLLAFSFLVSPFFINRKLKTMRVFYFYTFISIIVAFLIYLSLNHSFLGFINFKFAALLFINSLLIIFLNLTAIFALFRKRKSFNHRIFQFLILTIFLSIISEIVLMGFNKFYILFHLIRLIIFSLIYLVFVQIGLRKPYRLLFKELKDSEVNHARSEQTLKIIFNNANIGILMTDLTGRILEINQSFINLSGYSREELLNISLSNSNVTSINIFDKVEFSDLINEKIEQFEFTNTFLKKSFKQILTKTSISLIKDENAEPQYLLWLIQDISESEEIEKTKIEFISLASHQLRTHLTSIRLASELLLREIKNLINNKQSQYLNEINDSSKLMSEMIKDLLNLSRVELGTLMIKPESINFDLSLKEIISELSLQIQEKKINLIKNYSSETPLLFFDKQILRMMIENMLSNAICYTPIGGTIRINTEVMHSEIKVSISDNGCGISEEDKALIFNKSFRAKNAKEINPNGSGLGLYIIKSISEKTEARVWFESEEGIGSTFYFSIPLIDTSQSSRQGQFSI